MDLDGYRDTRSARPAGSPALTGTSRTSHGPSLERSASPARTSCDSQKQRLRSGGSLAQVFLDAVAVQATDAVARAERLTDLRERYRSSVRASTRGIANQLTDLVFSRPVLTAGIVEGQLGVSRPAALKALRHLADLGVLIEAPSGPRHQLRSRAHAVLEILTDEPD